MDVTIPTANDLNNVNNAIYGNTLQIGTTAFTGSANIQNPKTSNDLFDFLSHRELSTIK